MPTYYTVVQCVPDPVIDERINFGVIVYGDGQIRARFVKNWQRIRNFGVRDTAFLRDFADRIRDAEASQGTLPGVPGLRRFDEEALRRIIGSWASGIQFSEPKGSLRPADIVLDDVARRFLRGGATSARRHRTRRAAARIAEQTVTEQLTERAASPEVVEHLLRLHPDMPGKLEDHRIDVAVANSRWHFGVHGLSLELEDVERLESQYTNVVYAVSDVRGRNSNLPLGVVVLEPRSESNPKAAELLGRARRVFEKARIAMLTEQSLPDWVREQIDHIPEQELDRPSSSGRPRPEEGPPQLFPFGPGKVRTRRN